MTNYQGASVTLSTSYGDLNLLPCSGSGCPAYGTWFNATKSIKISGGGGGGGTVDLVVDHLEITREDTGETLTPGDSVPDGTSIRIRVYIKNTGRVDIVDSFTVKYYDNGSYIDDDTESSDVDAGGEDVENEYDVFTISGEGQHTLRVDLDTDNAIAESNESNNSATFVVNVEAQSNVDLEVHSGEIITEGPFYTGRTVPFQTQASVQNVGTQSAGESVIRSYVSQEVNGEPLSESTINHFTVPPLGPGEINDNIGLQLVTPSRLPAGRYYVVFEADCYDYVEEIWEGAEHNRISVPLDLLDPVPVAPTNLTATPVSESEISLSWSHSSESTEQFRIERSSSETGEWVVLDTTDKTQMTYSDTTGLAPGTTYYYRVIASNDGGDSEPSNVASATTLMVLPDFIIVAAYPPTPPYIAGNEITARVMVQNESSGFAEASVVEAWISDGPLGDAIDPATRGASPIPSLGAGETSPLVEFSLTIPSTLSPGTYYLVFAANADGTVDESNVENNRHSLEIDIEQREETLDIQLPPEETCMMISLPLIAPNSPIETVLASIEGKYSIVRSFATSTGTWLKYAPDGPSFGNTLTHIGPTDGLWLCSNQAGTLTLSGNYPAHSDIMLAPGWNLVGFPVNSARSLENVLQPIEGQYNLVRTYDHITDNWMLYSMTGPSFGNTISHIQPGVAYWIYITEATTLTITNP
ncbi:MAG: hypothetical protein HC893_00925 [Chloroflexaceae bacterium]|nr:hypothetical protein [Chloroflexaceae bacterium]